MRIYFPGWYIPLKLYYEQKATITTIVHTANLNCISYLEIGPFYTNDVFLDSLKLYHGDCQ